MLDRNRVIFSARNHYVFEMLCMPIPVPDLGARDFIIKYRDSDLLRKLSFWKTHRNHEGLRPPIPRIRGVSLPKALVDAAPKEYQV